jgi:hypothetical protein
VPRLSGPVMQVVPSDDGDAYAAYSGAPDKHFSGRF